MKIITRRHLKQLFFEKEKTSQKRLMTFTFHKTVVDETVLLGEFMSVDMPVCKGMLIDEIKTEPVTCRVLSVEERPDDTITVAVIEDFSEEAD